ncbi:agmatine deiminase family protein [Sphingorhabdus arenilitoris]|uniref:Agmatine deiminase family protein n=1 Tax=Sphingorhabdus arenilitoris TaxID=1490041 RepID=A0ABV8RHX0_9SPHN
MTYRMPAEWAAHEKVWIGFPSHENAWGPPLAEAQRQMAAFANAVHDGGAGETVYLIAGSSEAAFFASEMTVPGVHVEQYSIGDVWLRDTACIIVSDGDRQLARNFGFNGWGDRYHYPGDQSIGAELAKAHGFEVTQCDWILEGGSIDVDGEGLAVTTTDCLLNPNRNPDLTKTDIEARLERDLGIDRLLWLGDGLGNDHTDGHIDNLARFVAPGHLVMPSASGTDDPNEAVYDDARRRAEEFGCQVSLIPSVGKYEQDGEIVPASYMNFYIGNRVVVVPVYGSKYDDDALSALAPLFPGRRVIGLPADAILTGGGSFHCSSQQIPLV